MKRLLPEWCDQDGILLAWSTSSMDWAEDLEEVERCYTQIIRAILEFEPVYLLAPDAELIRERVGEGYPHALIVIDDIPLNDTWARDFGPLSLSAGSDRAVIDFRFNAWGMKFASNMDNLAVRSMFDKGLFEGSVKYLNAQDFTFEGGAIETDGRGVAMTTRSVLAEANRNPSMNLTEQKAHLKNILGLQHLYILDTDPLPGDDTDGHIDTLARFCDPHTIVYSYTEDMDDPRYPVVKALKAGVIAMKDVEDHPYDCVPIPLPDILLDDEGNAMPATYANFLILNGAVLLPVYGVDRDEEAIQIIKGIFPEREVCTVNCLPLIRQHGSLHCISMQIPRGFLSL